MANIWTDIAEMNTEVIPAKIIINGCEITVNERYFSTISIETGCMQDGYISYGGTFSPSCSISMQDHELIQNGTFFEVYFEIEGKWEHFGKYKITSEPRRQHGTVEFSGVGFISSIFDSTIIELNGPDLRRLHGFKEVVSMLEERTGVDIELDQKPSWIDDIGVMFPGFIDEVDEVDEKTKRYKSLTYTAREILGGLAILFGGNAIERGGKIHLSLASRSGSSMTKVFTEDAYSECIISQKTYAPAPIKLCYQPYAHGTIPDSQNLTYVYYKSGSKKTATLSAEPPSGGIVPDVLYGLQLECDWIAYSILEHNPTMGHVWSGEAPAYRPFEGEFCGYHPYLAAGNEITVLDENGNQQQVFCDSVTYEWDGGMSIKASSSFEAVGESGEVSSTVTSSTSSGGMTAQQLGQQNEVAAFKSVYTNYVEANNAKIGVLEVENEVVKSKLEVLGEIYSNTVTTENLVSKIAELGYVTADEVVSKIGEYEFLTSQELNSQIAALGYITAEVTESLYLKVSQADLLYADITLANIDTANINKESVGQLFTEIGILQNVTIKDGAVTGELNGVRINGDLIDANTLAADRLILRGENGLVYEINAACSGLSLAELADEQYKEALSGTVLVAKSVTAEQINVDTELVRQLFAHDVTATGTIMGVTLKGADAEIVRGKIGDWCIDGYGIYREDDYGKFEVTARVDGKHPGAIKATNKNPPLGALNVAEMNGFEWTARSTDTDLRRSLYVNAEDGFVFGIYESGKELAANTTKINLGTIKAGESVTTPAVYTDKLKLKNTNYGIEIGTTASGGTAGVRIGDLSGGNGSYTYITNDCVAQHSLDVNGQLSVRGATDGIFHAVTYRPTANLALSTTASKFSGYSLVLGEGHVDYYSATGGDIKTLKAGKYLVSAQVYFTNGFTENDIVHVFLYQNDSQVTETQYRFTTGGPYACIALAPYIVSCSAGDTISLRCYNQNGSRGNVGNTKTHITIIQL